VRVAGVTASLPVSDVEAARRFNAGYPSKHVFDCDTVTTNHFMG